MVIITLNRILLMFIHWFIYSN